MGFHIGGINNLSWLAEYVFAYILYVLKTHTNPHMSCNKHIYILFYVYTISLLDYQKYIFIIEWIKTLSLVEMYLCTYLCVCMYEVIPFSDK